METELRKKGDKGFIVARVMSWRYGVFPLCFPAGTQTGPLLFVSTAGVCSGTNGHLMRLC